MPTYEFQSDKGKIIERFYSIKDRPEFITYRKVRYNRIMSLPTLIVDSKKPKTVGSLAEKNTEKMLKSGKIKKKKEEPLPFWRKSKKVDTSLASMSKIQKRRYIETGKR